MWFGNLQIKYVLNKDIHETYQLYFTFHFIPSFESPIPWGHLTPFAEFFLLSEIDFVDSSKLCWLTTLESESVESLDANLGFRLPNSAEIGNRANKIWCNSETIGKNGPLIFSLDWYFYMK